MRNGMRFFTAFPVLCVEVWGRAILMAESHPASQKCNAPAFCTVQAILLEKEYGRQELAHTIQKP